MGRDREPDVWASVKLTFSEAPWTTIVRALEPLPESWAERDHTLAESGDPDMLARLKPRALELANEAMIDARIEVRDRDGRTR